MAVNLQNPFSDILASYAQMQSNNLNAEKNALAFQMDQERLAENKRQFETNRNDQFALKALDQQNWQKEFNTAKDQWNQTFQAEQQVRDAQIEGYETETLAKREQARQQLVSTGARMLQNMTGGLPIAEALQQGVMGQDDLDSWLREFGGAYKVFDYKGQTREYVGVERLPNGMYTIKLRDPATGKTGPMTSEGGSDGSEKIIQFDEGSLPGIYQSIDNRFNAALGTGGRQTWNQVGNILNRNAGVGAPDVTTQDQFNPRDAVVANSVNARAGGTRGVGDAATTRGDAGIRAIDPLAAAESDRRNAALGMVDGALNRGTVNRKLGGNELYTLNMLQGLDKGGLTSEQFGNAATGDSITGGAAARNKDRLATGIQMAQDATGNIANIQDNQATREATAAKDAATAARNAKTDFDTAYSAVDEAVREVISVYSPDMEDGFAESQAQAFKTIVAKGYNDPASRDLYGAIINNPTVTRTVADSWSQLERARKQLNSGDFTGSEKGFWNNAFRTMFGAAYDIANPDMAQQHTDVAMLGAVAGQANMKAFLRDVILPVHNQSNRNIPPAAYRSAAQVIIRMNNARAERGENPLSAQESKVMIQRHLLGKGGGAKEESAPPVQAPVQEAEKTLTRRGLR